MDLLLSLLVLLIVAGLIYWAAHRLGAAFGIPGIILTIIDVLLVIVVVFYLLRLLGLMGRLSL
jgi:hypothetical protein